MKKLLLAAALAALAPSAMAEGFYADGGYSFIGISEDDIEADIGAFVAHAGYKFTDVFSVEGELGFGVADEEVSVSDVDVDLGLNYLAGIFARGDFAVTENVDLFARVGLVQAELEAEASAQNVTISESDSESGFALGLGGQANLTNNVFLRGEYTRYDIEDLEADAFTIAVGFTFGATN